MLVAAAIASIRDSGNRLKVGCSLGADAVRPGRDNEPVVSSDEEGFSRVEPSDGSSLDFIVWSFLARLVFNRPDCVVAAQAADAEKFDIPVERVGRQGELERCGRRAGGRVAALNLERKGVELLSGKLVRRIGAANFDDVAIRSPLNVIDIRVYEIDSKLQFVFAGLSVHDVGAQFTFQLAPWKSFSEPPAGPIEGVSL